MTNRQWKNKQIQTNNAWKQTKTETPQTEEEREEQMAIWAVGGIKQINASGSTAATFSESQDYS